MTEAADRDTSQRDIPQARVTPQPRDAPRTTKSAAVSDSPEPFDLPSSGPWPTADPFLFCVHHVDAYPRSRGDLTPDASLANRSIGQDFANIDGWNMYHGSAVPGFPVHPHRGFETITYLRSGVVDHSDSLGAKARFGPGDAQWLTAGKGIQHSEMLPLLKVDQPNPLEFFQIWLNLPAVNKLVDPYFSMMWSGSIPVVGPLVHGGTNSTVTMIVGAGFGKRPGDPPPDSWASSPGSDVAVWHIALGDRGSLTLPDVAESVTRTLYVFSSLNADGSRTGGDVRIDGTPVRPGQGAEMRTSGSVYLQSDSPADVLLLQGAPIGEPIATYGPFVMNTEDEIRQAFLDYRQSEFGGWPFTRPDPSHGEGFRRFARHPDGSLDRPQ